MNSKILVKGFLITKWLLTSRNLNSLLSKKNNETVKTEQVSTGNDVAEIASSVKLLGIHIYKELDCNSHIGKTCESVSKFFCEKSNIS